MTNKDLSKKKRVSTLVMGSPISFPGTDRADFFTRKHLADYEVVLVDPQGALKGSEYDYTIRLAGVGVLRMQRAEADAYLQQFRDMANRISNYIVEGGFCAIVLRALPVIHSVSVLGDVTEIPLTPSMPYEDCIEAHGQNIEWSKQEPFRLFGSQTEDCWTYNAYFTDRLEPVANVRGRPSHGLAAHRMTQASGHAVILPTPVVGSGDAAARIIAAIHQLKAHLSAPEQQAFHLPDWTDDYLLPEEDKAKKSIETTDQQLKELYARIKLEKARLAEIRQFKLLFVGSDSALERVVDSALTELGMVVSPGERKRVDRTATWNDHLFAIEIQGVKKGATEDHARSLAVWVEEVGAQQKKDAKGLLVVNTFRETLPQDRTASSWPGQTLTVCERKGFCAITGLQLLGLVVEGRRNPTAKATLVQRLLDTNGAFSGYEDWKQTLQLTK